MVRFLVRHLVFASDVNEHRLLRHWVIQSLEFHLTIYSIIMKTFYFFNSFFIEGKLLYRILLFPVILQSESTIGVYIYIYIYPLPFETSSHLSPHPTPLGWYRAPVWVSWAIENRLMDIRRGDERVRCMQRVTWKLMLPYENSQWEFLYSHWLFDRHTTERLPFHFSLSCIGEGNGNPLQYSCLENPRDGGAWWAAVCGVTQSRTWLKWLSSNST